MTQDVVVIGAGVIGVACALSVARSGQSVLLLDVQEPGNGCSYGNAGLIAIDHVVPMATPDTLARLPQMLLRRGAPLRLRPAGLAYMGPWLSRFVQACAAGRVAAGTAALGEVLAATNAAWQRLERAAGQGTLLRRCGCLYLQETPARPQADARTRHQLGRYGIVYEDLEPKAALARYLPGLRVPATGARFFPDMMSVADPFQVVASLFSAATEAGATFRRTRVRRLDVHDGLVRGVFTDSDYLSCASVVVCAGVGSGPLLDTLGLHLPITRERGYSVDLEAAPATLGIVPITFLDRGFVLNPMAGFVRLAGTVELGAAGPPDWRRAAVLERHYEELFGLAPNTRSRWSGDRPTLPDYLPAIGQIPGIRNACVATGHQHLGLTLAAVTAELVLELMQTRTTRHDLSPFRVDRFSKNFQRHAHETH